MKTKKTGVSIPKDVLEKVDRLIEELNLKSRSKVITEALNQYISEKTAFIEEGATIYGIIILIYDHHRGDTMKRLTGVQHNYLEEIVFNIHLHMTEHKCLEMVVVRGISSRIRSLVADLEKIQGVEFIRCIPIRI